MHWPRRRSSRCIPLRWKTIAVISTRCRSGSEPCKRSWQGGAPWIPRARFRHDRLSKRSALGQPVAAHAGGNGSGRPFYSLPPRRNRPRNDRLFRDLDRRTSGLIAATSAMLGSSGSLGASWMTLSGEAWSRDAGGAGAGGWGASPEAGFPIRAVFIVETPPWRFVKVRGTASSLRSVRSDRASPSLTPHRLAISTLDHVDHSGSFKSVRTALRLSSRLRCRAS